MSDNDGERLPLLGAKRFSPPGARAPASTYGAGAAPPSPRLLLYTPLAGGQAYDAVVIAQHPCGYLDLDVLLPDGRVGISLTMVARDDDGVPGTWRPRP